MTKNLIVWILDPNDTSKPPRMDTTPRYVNHGPHDHMRKQAVEHIKRAEYKLRTVNHTTDGHMVAYVYPKNAKLKTATKVPGWVFKTPTIPAIIK